MERPQVLYYPPYPAGTNILQSVAAKGGENKVKNEGVVRLKINLRYYYQIMYSVINNIESVEAKGGKTELKRKVWHC